MASANTQVGEEVLVRPPGHPVPSLQGPFEESMSESVKEDTDFDVPIDAISRRTILLDSPYYQRVVAGRWKQKPGEKFHPLWKLVAQMSFGLHLLARNMAKSEDEVMKILQAHVDDIDGFLERTSEDFELAQNDMHERLRCLKLPLQHGDVFDRMLEDRTFRASILEGNEKIEHIVSRTKKMLKDALKDVQKGFDATNVLEKYLIGLAKTWDRETPEHEAVYVAMLGNVEGWRRAFMELHLQGNKVAGTLKKLIEVVAEMQRRAAAVSRSIVTRSQVASQPSRQSNLAAKDSVRNSIQKPLPQAPTRTRDTKRSSRSLKFIEDSGRPDSAPRSDHDQSSESRPQSNQSSQPRSRSQTPNTVLSTALLKSNVVSQESTPNKDSQPSMQRSKLARENDVVIELPADVPEEVMRQAPVSVKNRLSYTLGLKPRDATDHRVSSIYYPNALRDLLKISPSANMTLSPNPAASKATALRSISPQTAQTSQPSSDADYFSAHERSPSIGNVTPGTSKLVDSSKGTPDIAETPDTVRSPRQTPMQEQRQSARTTPALNSHTSVMAMASPPVELSAVTELLDRPPSRSRQPSQSSLGEPGPEIADTESDSGTHAQADVAVNVQHTKAASIDSRPLDADADRDIALSQAEVLTALPALPDPESTPTNSAQALRTSPTGDQADDAPNHESGRVVSATADERRQIHAHLDPSRVTPVQRTNTAPLTSNPLSTEPIIAELEAVVPARSSAPPTTQAFAPIELEAPRQTFILPPRPPDQPRRKVEPEPKRLTVRERIALMRKQAEQDSKPSMKPKDFRNSAIPEPIEPLRVKLTKVDGKLVPVINHPVGVKPGHEPRLSQDLITSMIEQMSTSPAESPALEQSESPSSPNSAQTRSKRSSQVLGPPGSAPAPLAPGGRSMVEPDFAAVGQFEGERAHQQKGSGSSKGEIKDIVNNSGSGRNSSDTSSKSARNSSARKSDSARGSATDMLTSAGKDVLWFRDEGSADGAVEVTST